MKSLKDTILDSLERGFIKTKLQEFIKDANGECRIDEEEKYVICDVAKSESGKTSTLLDVITLLKSSDFGFVEVGKPIQIDSGCDVLTKLVYKNNLSIVVLTYGDDYDSNNTSRDFFQMAYDMNADVIICASRMRNSRMYQHIRKIVDTDEKYKMIEFSNFSKKNNKEETEDCDMKNGLIKSFNTISALSIICILLVLFPTRMK